LFLGGALLRLLLRNRPVAEAPTWGCSYVASTPRMQYTASSFAQMLVGLFSWALRPRTDAARALALFPQPSSFRSDVPDSVLDDAVLPAFHRLASFFVRFRVFQRGSI